MLALISPAKKMAYSTQCTEHYPTTTPRFGQQATAIAQSMLAYSAEELEVIFKVSRTIARELKGRFEGLFDDDKPTQAAIDCYDGVVYRHIKSGEILGDQERDYLQEKVRISSLLYGLLRPMDQVKPYRMEGFVRLADSDSRVDQSWREHQTQLLIEDVNNAGGELIYLASQEEQSAFNWREVKRNVRVIEIQFLQHKGDKLRQVVVYTKMARGEMIRYMMKNNIQNSEDLKSFEWSGYRYSDQLSKENVWVWVMDDML